MIPVGELLKYERVEDSAAISHYLRECLANPQWSAMVFELGRSGALSSGHLLPPVQNKGLGEIERALRSGRLILLRRRWQRGGAGAGEESQALKMAAGAGAGAARTGKAGKDTSSELTWIDVQLVDEDDHPVPGEKYQLQLTDGSMRQGTLDSEGRVRITGIPHGACQVCFPDFDGGEWRRA